MNIHDLVYSRGSLLHKSLTAQCCELVWVELFPSGVWTLILHIPLT